MKGFHIYKLFCSFLLLDCFDWGQCQRFPDLYNATALVTSLQLPNTALNHGLSSRESKSDTTVTGTFRNYSKCDVTSNVDSYAQNLSKIGFEKNKKPSGTVELLVIVDKELGDTFGQNRRAILDYLTAYFWDISLRYKTLDGVSLTFRITEVIIITNFDDQRFIEGARFNDGRVSFHEAHKRFNHWLYLNSDSPGFPDFDLATLFTKSEDPESIAGVANIRGACKTDPSIGTMLKGVILRDYGSFDGLLFAAHEIGHALGAYHDIDPAGCDGIYIMNATATYERRWFFSPCSSHAIANFIRSSEASCLKRIDSKRPLPIHPDFSSVKAPDRTEQCRQRLKNAAAFVREEDSWDCAWLRCSVPVGNQVQHADYILDLDNTPCGRDGRCFRGKCREQGSLLVNVATGKCLSTIDKYNDWSSVTLTNCPERHAGSPLDRFLITETPNGKMLSTPYQAAGPRHEEACLRVKKSLRKSVFAEKCDIHQSYQKWDMIDSGNGKFLIRHRATRKCLKVKWNKVKVSICNSRDVKMQWKLL